MSQCRHCYGPIRFVTLDSGKPIPVEPHPAVDRGTVAAQMRGRRLVGYVISQAKPLLPGFQTFVVHRARCKPDAPRVPASQRPASLF